MEDNKNIQYMKKKAMLYRYQFCSVRTETATVCLPLEAGFRKVSIWTTNLVIHLQMQIVLAYSDSGLFLPDCCVADPDLGSGAF